MTTTSSITVVWNGDHATADILLQPAECPPRDLIGPILKGWLPTFLPSRDAHAVVLSFLDVEHDTMSVTFTGDDAATVAIVAGTALATLHSHARAMSELDGYERGVRLTMIEGGA